MTAHVAILSGPGIGHLFPSSELGRRLVRHHNISVTLITQSLGSPSNTERSLMDSLREEMSVVSIPPPPPETIPNNKNLISLLFFISRYSVPHLRTILNSLATTTTTTTPPLRALVVDMFFDEATLDMARELGVGHYMFFTSPFTLLSFALHLPELDKTYDGEYTDMPEPLKLPGYSQTFRGQDLPQPVLERKSEVYTNYLSLVKLYYKTDGILVNSSQVLEPELLKGLKEDKRIPPVFPVGPLIRSCSSDDVDASECLRWLDKQPQGSVLYVSFGSGGTLTSEQMKELAFGLELSMQRFLWVVTKPNDHEAYATYFGGKINKSSFDFLPTGFLDRTKDLGLVVLSWVPQVRVLGHASIGGFLTHCGWNSTLESITNGVPLIAWPLYAEQNMNAVMLEEGMKVAVRAKVDETGIVRRQEVLRLIKCLIEEEINGGMMRNKMNQISKATALAVEESGSSFISIKEVARGWIGLSPN